MKKLLLLVSLISSVSFAQNCSKLFISEYVEGWGNNKALEIYNPTSAPVDLSQYFVARYSNGSTSATVENAVQLSGIVAPGDVHVAVLEKLDPAGMGQEAPIWDSLEARADGFYAPVYALSNSFYWNGNDAILLAKGTLPTASTASVTTAVGFQIVDIFGKIGENPADLSGSTAGNAGAWSSGFPYSTGLGVLLTQDHSLIRKASVQVGVTTPVSFFNPLSEWDSIPPVTILTNSSGDTLLGGSGSPILFGNWFSLGSHTCDCVLATEDKTTVEMSIYPNPSNDGIFYIKNAADVKEIAVFNTLGQQIQKFNGNTSSNYVLRLGDDRGVFVVRITSADGNVSTKRVIVK